MQTIFRPSWMVLLLTAWAASSAEFKFPGHTFTLPDGYSMEVVAGPPLVNRPIVADFDEQGRLYVADSSGLTDKGEKQLELKPHRIVRLEDKDGDGRFERSTVFADKMMFPEGVLWFDGAVYCGAPPSIWKIEDIDGDGVSDRRSEWYQGKTLTGCANDLHGPYLGLDGYIYWCKGAFAKQTHERPGRPAISDSAAHIFRCRPDGSDFDSVMSGGMDNPVEIIFTRAGEVIFTTTFYSHPGGGKRDALVHAIYGGVYPKMHNVLEGLKRTGDLLPPLTELGPAVPCGLARYASSVFGADFQDNLFSAQFNLHKVQRHILEPAGSTFRTRDLDFVVSDNPDFHPTDVLEDADGSLLVLDTGGWYRICCPTSQLAKPDILGAIYRIRRDGGPRIPDPRGLKLAWQTLPPEKLAALLDDPRPAVQKRALAALAKAGAGAVEPLTAVLKSSRSVEARVNTLWALTRLDAPAARDAIRLGLADPNETVRQVAVYSTGLYRDRAAVADLVGLLKSANPHLQRAAATALGRIGDRAAVGPLLDTASTAHDRMLEHALIYALLEIAAPGPTLAGLTGGTPSRRRAAMMALDQMDGGGLDPQQVVRDLTSREPVLKETAFWIASRHPEWGSQLSAVYSQWLNDKKLEGETADELRRQLSQLASDPSIQKLIADRAQGAEGPPAGRLVALKAMAQASLKTPPPGWGEIIQSALRDSDERVLRQGLLAARSLFGGKSNSVDLTRTLLALAHDPDKPVDLRLQALGALPQPLEAVDTSLLQFLYAALAPDRPVIERTTAATVLGRARLTDPQLFTLTEIIKSAGPLELTQLMPAFDNSTNEAIGLKLIAALKTAKSIRAARADLLKARWTKFSPMVQEQGDDLLRGLDLDPARQKARLDELQAALPAGDIRRGQALFNSPKAACSTCHAIGYLGGQIGPDLTRIGAVRTERDLLESIVYPSATFVRSYEPMTIVSRDGEEWSGIVKSETADSILLISGPSTEQRINRANISEMRPGTVSVMPEGLDQQLTKQELADLLAFLRSLK